MDQVSSNPQRNDNSNGPLAPSSGAAEPIRLAEAPAGPPAGVSRAPLNLGGGAAAPAAPSVAKAPVPRPAPPKPAAAGAAGDRITACKTFFTKLHPGALHFLEEIIAKWLKENPQIVVKQTNVFQGEITEKKTEQNIVIVLWY